MRNSAKYNLGKIRVLARIGLKRTRGPTEASKNGFYDPENPQVAIFREIY